MKLLGICVSCCVEIHPGGIIWVFRYVVELCLNSLSCEGSGSSGKANFRSSSSSRRMKKADKNGSHSTTEVTPRLEASFPTSRLETHSVSLFHVEVPCLWWATWREPSTNLWLFSSSSSRSNSHSEIGPLKFGHMCYDKIYTSNVTWLPWDL